MRLLRYLPFVVLVAGACGGDVSTAPSLDINALVDQASGGGVAYSAAALSASVPVTTAVLAVPTGGGTSCPYSISSQRFVCVPVTSNGITITRSYALLDASGQPLAIANPVAVAAIRVISDVKGTTTGGAGGTGTVTIDRHEDATMTGLPATTHVINSTATQRLDVSGAAASFTSNETSATVNLQVPQVSATQHWPLGGKITTDRTLTIVGLLGAATSREVLSFDGSSVATLSRTTGSITTTCKVDLSKPVLTAVCA